MDQKWQKLELASGIISDPNDERGKMASSSSRKMTTGATMAAAAAMAWADRGGAAVAGSRGGRAKA